MFLGHGVLPGGLGGRRYKKRISSVASEFGAANLERGNCFSIT